MWAAVSAYGVRFVSHVLSNRFPFPCSTRSKLAEAHAQSADNLMFWSAHMLRAVAASSLRTIRNCALDQQEVGQVPLYFGYVRPAR